MDGKLGRLRGSAYLMRPELLCVAGAMQEASEKNCQRSVCYTQLSPEKGAGNPGEGMLEHWVEDEGREAATETGRAAVVGKRRCTEPSSAQHESPAQPSLVAGGE